MWVEGLLWMTTELLSHMTLKNLGSLTRHKNLAKPVIFLGRMIAQLWGTRDGANQAKTARPSVNHCCSSDCISGDQAKASNWILLSEWRSLLCSHKPACSTERRWGLESKQDQHQGA